jgi:hypothetical protein
MCKLGDMNTLVKRYMAQIGRKGGLAGRGTLTRMNVARKAAAARWAPSPIIVGKGSRINITSDGSTLRVAPCPSELPEHLKYYRPFYDNGRLTGIWEGPFTLDPDNSLSTYAGFYSRIKAFLTGKGYSIRYRRLNPQYPKPDCAASVFEELTPEQKRNVEAMLEIPGGAVVRASREDGMAIITGLVKAFSKYRGFIVAEEIGAVQAIRTKLKQALAPLGIGVGILTGTQADDADVVVLTAAQLKSGLIRPEDSGFLIFFNPPRKGFVWDTWMLNYFQALKFAICDPVTKYPKWRRTEIEAVFGPTVNG